MNKMIDLSKLPAPAVIEELSYENILQEAREQLQGLYPELVLVESDPAIKVLEVMAYRELLIRQRVNDASHGVMLAYAEKADLDQIGANFSVERHIIDAGDPDANPPIPAIYEKDDEFRDRIQLSMEGQASAGSTGQYVFHALRVCADVRKVHVESPAPTVVHVYILTRAGNGVPDQAALDAVQAGLTAEEVRPLTDQVIVKPVEIIPYTVDATLYVDSGPSPEAVKQAAEKAVQAYVSERHTFGAGVPLSGLYAALHVGGVNRVVLIAPTAEINVDKHQAAFCTTINVTVQNA
ncbi:MAG: baseplate J/gp47 family protein [Desulfovibrio sp.]